MKIIVRKFELNSIFDMDLGKALPKNCCRREFVIKSGIVKLNFAKLFKNDDDFYKKWFFLENEGAKE